MNLYTYALTYTHAGNSGLVVPAVLPPSLPLRPKPPPKHHILEPRHY